MTFNILILIIIITGLVSYKAFNDRAFMDRLLFVPYLVKSDKNYYRFFSHMFIHANWMHLGFNMMSLYFLGDMLLNQEGGAWQTTNGDISILDNGLLFHYGPIMGTIHFALIYFLGGLFATTISFIRHQGDSSYRSLGASGAVSAVIFAGILWNPDMSLGIMFIPIPIKAYIFGPLYLIAEYIMSKRGGTGIAHDAHIGGAIFGVIYVLIINIDKGSSFLNYFAY